MILAKKLENVVGEENLHLNEDMRNHCSFKTGGKADCFIEPMDEEALVKTIKILREENMPFDVIGNGSNLLVGDKGIRGAVIHIGKYFSEVSICGTSVEIGAGALLSSAAQCAMEKGLKNFEFAGGIPGSFGGAVFMNAGAYGGEIKDVLESVTVLDEGLQVITLNTNQLELGYRTSIFSKKGYILLKGKINLKEGDKAEIKALMADFSQRRRDKQPLNLPSAGSTFKRPDGYFAGQLIEESGLKGYTVGGAMVSEKHAGFVVNKGNATTEDILAVISHCKDTVKEKFGVRLETEIRFLGEQ